MNEQYTVQCEFCGEPGHNQTICHKIIHEKDRTVLEREKPLVDSRHSELERNQEKLEKYVQLLEQALGHGIRVVGILEIGSFANGEGMESSDIDTRVYVESPDVYVWNVDGHKSSETFYGGQKDKFDAFIAEYGERPVVNFTWGEFNEPMWKQLKEDLGISVEFGLVDKRYAEFELNNLGNAPANEHSFVMQSNVVYDPQQFLARKYEELDGKIVPAMSEFYNNRFLRRLPPEIYRSVEISETDLIDIRDRHKIQWVKWAVRCLREAVATKSYMTTGHIIHEQEEVLAFYKKYLPKKYPLVVKLYDWKVNSISRDQMIEECIDNPEAMSQRFRKIMPEIEATVEAINDLIL